VCEKARKREKERKRERKKERKREREKERHAFMRMTGLLYCAT
jgi:hypothetical protein